MCGIAGLASFDEPVDARLLKAMTDIVRYRGPDDEGFAVWGHVEHECALPREKTYIGRRRPERIAAAETFGLAFGHRRLSILDLSSAGRQPMASACGRYWVVFNGEIYNYRELKAELNLGGWRFTSNCDTEVILAAYAHWGEGCLHHFNGIWAFAIYDSNEELLFASRDRFGVKPLYFANLGNRLAFASEIKQLIVPGFGNGKADRGGVAQFLLHGNSNTLRETMFQGVQQLLPGEALRLRLKHGLKSLSVYRYYSPHFNAAMHRNGTSLNRFREEFCNLLEDSVGLQLRSDVPVGTCLSGGLDSSAIVLTASRLLKSEGSKDVQKSFTSCFEDPTYDEWQYASSVAAAAGVEAHRVFPDLNRLWDEMAEFTWHHDEPIGGTSAYAQWNVMRLARSNGVKVLLDGQGADEVMGGYHYFVLDFLTSLLRRSQIISLVRNLRSMQTTGLLRTAVLDTACSPIQLLLRSARRLAGMRTLRKPTLYAVVKPEHRGPNQRHRSSALSFQGLLHDAIFGSLQALLRYEDRNSMAFSIEARVPYLDHRIVELFLRMPGIYKMRDGWTKPFIRDAMQGLMPENVRLRVDKKGFVTPEPVWYRNMRDRIRAELLSPDSPTQIWVDPGRLGAWLDAESSRRQGEFSIWRLLSVNAWMKRFSLA